MYMSLYVLLYSYVLTRRLFKGFLRLSAFAPSVREEQSSRCMLQLHRGRGKGAGARKFVISVHLENDHSSIPTWYNLRPTQYTKMSVSIAARTSKNT